MFFFFQAEDGIRDLVRSRGLGDVYKRQSWVGVLIGQNRIRCLTRNASGHGHIMFGRVGFRPVSYTHLTLPTSDLVEISVVAVSLKKKNM